MIALELGIAFVTGVLIGAILMALMAARGNDELHIENARLRRLNYRLELTLRRLHPRADLENLERSRDALRQARSEEAQR